VPGLHAPKHPAERLASDIVSAGSNCYFSNVTTFLGKRRPAPPARVKLPTSEGFAKLSDRARLPGRFFYRLTLAGGW